MGNYNKKESKRKVNKTGYSWATLLYPESMSPDYQQILTDRAVPCLVSPLHDSDVNEDGTPKKPHYHVLFKFPKQKSNLQIEDLISALGGVGCELIYDAGQYARYLTHMDDDDKHAYSESDVQSFGDIDYKKLTAPKMDTVDAFTEIIDLIENNDLRTYTEVVRCCKLNRPELMKAAMDKSYAIGQYLRGIRETEQRAQKAEHDKQVAQMEFLIADGWKPIGKQGDKEIWGKQTEMNLT